MIRNVSFKREMLNGDYSECVIENCTLGDCNLYQCSVLHCTGKANVYGGMVRESCLQMEAHRDLIVDTSGEGNLHSCSLKGKVGGYILHYCETTLWNPQHKPIPIDLERDSSGLIVYKGSPSLYPGMIIREACNPNPTVGTGEIEVGTLAYWRYQRLLGPIWKCRIPWEYVPWVVVPFLYEGRFRTSYLEVIDVTK